tara:strand:- start:249 stop:563 length:315 start_codon:yes stop_codon:yes gene_type:complete
MNEKIKQFDTWFSNAKPREKFTYFTGNLAYSVCLADGLPLKQLRDHIMNKCCKWDLEPTAKKETDNRILFKKQIRLVQKGHKMRWNKKKQNEAFRDFDYMTIKL